MVYVDVVLYIKAYLKCFIYLALSPVIQAPCSPPTQFGWLFFIDNDDTMLLLYFCNYIYP